MGSEPVEELPDDVEAWIAERAAATDTSRAAVVRRLVAAHRLLDEHPESLNDADTAGPAPGDGIARSPDGVDNLDARLDDIAGRVEALESDLDEKITDVRERVIQIKREADAKAPADHDHPSIERRIDDGFGDYEEILESLVARTEALEDGAEDRDSKLRTVANAVVDLRRRVGTIEGVVEERAAVAALREEANRRGVTEAACDACGNAVQLGLLDEPACPHCGSPFDGVEPGGWFRSSRLTVGNRPALESGRTTADTRSEQPEPSGSNGHEASDPGASTAPTGRDATGGDPEERNAVDGHADAGDESSGEGDGSATDPVADGDTDEPGGSGSGDADGWAAPPESQGSDSADAGGDEGAVDR